MWKEEGGKAPQVNNFIRRDSHSNVFMMDELVSKKRE